MKLLIFGAGILGRLLAAQMHNAGVDVTLLARGKTLQKLQEQGVEMKNILNEEWIRAKVPLTDSLDNGVEYDVIIVLMRKNQALKILPSLVELTNSPPILFLGNNGTGITDYQQYLPPERILIGFLGAGGTQMGEVTEVIYYPATKITYGFMNQDQPDLIHRLDAVFQSAGFIPDHPMDIDAWLKSHLALIVPFAFGIMAANFDNYRMVRSRDALLLSVVAIRDAFHVLKALNIPILPSKLKIFLKVPKGLLIRLLQKKLNGRFAEIAMAGHVRAAPDEMSHLFEEFLPLIQQSNLEVPALSYLASFRDPQQERIPDGSCRLSLWKKVHMPLDFA